MTEVDQKYDRAFLVLITTCFWRFLMQKPRVIKKIVLSLVRSLISRKFYPNKFMFDRQVKMLTAFTEF